VAGSQIRTVPSSPAVVSQLPSGATATAHTMPGVAGEGDVALGASDRIPADSTGRRNTSNTEVADGTA
jgi:hypothetical protein